MPDDPGKSARRVLEPPERIAEVLFGLIMVLTFTGSLSVASADRAEVRTMLIGALGCNLAWGIIDAILYLMGSLAEKERSLRTLLAVRTAASPEAARRAIANAFPPALGLLLQAAELDLMRERMLQLSALPAKAQLTKSDWRGAFGVFLIVFLSTFPVALPFLLTQDAHNALRISNLIAVVMLFGAGMAYGRCIGRPPWMLGMATVILGGVLVALTMALGG